MHNLLIIDDEDIIINLLHDYFSHLGYSVVTAKNGSDGIDLFNANPNFDLVITDINMPGFDGNAVAKSIRLSQRPKVPIVGMSYPVMALPEEISLFKERSVTAP